MTKEPLIYMINPLISCYKELRKSARVLDVGSFGFRQYALANDIGLTGLRHHGVDYCEPAGPVPENFVFKAADLNRQPIPFEDDMFELVVVSHVIEHISSPVEFFGECVRVCKPGGLLYVEAPSEFSLLLPGMPFEHEKFCSLSFFDDPTHLSRPWTPQAFYRLSKYYSCDPLKAGRLYGPRKVRWLFPYFLIKALLKRDARSLQNCCWEALGWRSFLVARKPLDSLGKPSFRYYIPE
ncbi:MAG: class I SAM-dependent methyltransferase [Geobacter sp.]|nr:class I SAM-dependent methyltransferase [Geobacter sp.]